MLCVLLFVVFTSGDAAHPAFHSAVQHGSIQTSLIDDPSGLAVSHIHPGIYYTHNDHHGLNRVFAVDPKTGSLKAILTITGAVNNDWEDIAVAPCGGGVKESCIYIGDIGGSDGSLHNVIYKVQEPANLTDQALPILQQVQFTWDQPESECLMVDSSGHVYVVSREQDGGVVGRIPQNGWGATAVPITETQPLNINTGHHDPLACDISADGKEMLIKGKHTIYHYVVNNGDVLGAVKAHPQQVPYHYVTHGQGIAWTLSGDGYYTVAQHRHSIFYFYGRMSSEEAKATHPHKGSNPPNTPRFSSGEKKSFITSPDLNNISGLAASRVLSGIYYAYSNNGDSKKIFAVDPDNAGDIKATYTITGATNTDWEDIAVGPCPTGGSCIYLADTGRRGGPPNNNIYLVKEPTEIEDRTLALLDQLHFTWTEQGSMCLMVDPRGNTFITAKGTGGGKIAKIPTSAWSISSFHITKTKTLSFQTTDGHQLGCDLSVNGREMLIKTKNDIYYYKVTGGDVTATVQSRVASLRHHDEDHGTSISWCPSGGGYYTVGQGHNVPVYYYKRQ